MKTRWFNFVFLEVAIIVVSIELTKSVEITSELDKFIQWFMPLILFVMFSIVNISLFHGFKDEAEKDE